MSRTTAKFKSATIFISAAQDQTAKFKGRQKFRLYGIKESPIRLASVGIAHARPNYEVIISIRYLWSSFIMLTILATPTSYTFLVADYWSSTATLRYKPLWQFGEVTCYTAARPMHPQRILWQQCFFKRPTNVSQGVCVVSLVPRYSALQVDSHRIVSMIIHSIHNNPRSLSCTAEMKTDCDNPSAAMWLQLAPPQTSWVVIQHHSTYMQWLRFLVKSWIVHLDLIHIPECSYSHTNTPSVMENGLSPTPDNLHLGCSF